MGLVTRVEGARWNAEFYGPGPRKGGLSRGCEVELGSNFMGSSEEGEERLGLPCRKRMSSQL